MERQAKSEKQKDRQKQKERQATKQAQPVEIMREMEIMRVANEFPSITSLRLPLPISSKYFQPPPLPTSSITNFALCLLPS